MSNSDHRKSNIFTRTLAVVLAAGKGTRMQSDLPKVLHKLKGRPLVDWVLAALGEIPLCGRVLVVGPDAGDLFAPYFAKIDAVVEQTERKGTADAVSSIASVLPTMSSGPDQMPSYRNRKLISGNVINNAEFVLVCLGDVPLIQPQTLKDFLIHAEKHNADLSLIAFRTEEPTGYGRVLIEDGKISKIIEEKEATPDQKKINLVNSGIIFARTKNLFTLLSRVDSQNAASEFYLTDLFDLANKEGQNSVVFEVKNSKEPSDEFEGINTREQLAKLEKKLTA